jgi:hypothetical protein
MGARTRARTYVLRPAPFRTRHSVDTQRKLVECMSSRADALVCASEQGFPMHMPHDSERLSEAMAVMASAHGGIF